MMAPCSYLTDSLPFFKRGSLLSPPPRTDRKKTKLDFYLSLFHITSGKTGITRAYYISDNHRPPRTNLLFLHMCFETTLLPLPSPLPHPRLPLSSSPPRPPLTPLPFPSPPPPPPRTPVPTCTDAARLTLNPEATSSSPGHHPDRGAAVATYRRYTLYTTSNSRKCEEKSRE